MCGSIRFIGKHVQNVLGGCHAPNTEGKQNSQKARYTLESINGLTLRSTQANVNLKFYFSLSLRI